MDLSSFRGLIYRSPVAVITLGIFLLSLLGLPPLARPVDLDLGANAHAVDALASLDADLQPVACLCLVAQQQ